MGASQLSLTFLLKAIAPHAQKPLLFAALVLPTTRSQRILILGLIVAAECNNYLMLLNRPGRKALADYLAATGMLSALPLPLDWLLMTPDPRVALRSVGVRRQVTSGEKNDDATVNHTPGAKDRFWWALSQTFNVRAVGTPSQIPNIPPLSPELSVSRRSFCIWRSIYALLAIVRLGASYAIAANSSFARSQMFTSDQTILGRLMTTLFVVNLVYSFMGGSHAIVSVVAVGSGMSEPELWPDFFGSVWDLYSIRNAWGRFWHQTFRKPYTTIGNCIAHTILRRPPHSTLSRVIKLYTAFAITAVNHLPADLVVYSNILPPNATTFEKLFKVPPSEAWFTPQFFAKQATVIVIESAVIALLKRMFGNKKLRQSVKKSDDDESPRNQYEYVVPASLEEVGKVVGFVWVTCWFCWTIPPLCWGLLKWEFK